MAKKNKISSTQLFCLLLLSRGVLSIASGAFSGSGNIQSSSIAAAIAGIISLLMSIPALYAANGGREILHSSLGRVVSGIYALYFFYAVCVTLTIFTVMRAETADARISVIILPLLMVITAVYGAYKGIEAISRTGTLILFAVAAAFVLLCLSLFPKSNALNLEPAGALKINDIINETVIMLGEQSCIPAIIFLYPNIKGSVKKTVVSWIFVVFLCIGSLSLFIASILGDYAVSQPFPVYSWARLASFGVVQRLDSVFSAIWTAGVFVRLSLLLWVLSAAVKYAVGRKAAKLAPLIAGAAALAVSAGTPFNSGLRNGILNAPLLLSATAICSAALPALLIIKRRVDNR